MKKQILFLCSLLLISGYQNIYSAAEATECTLIKRLNGKSVISDVAYHPEGKLLAFADDKGIKLSNLDSEYTTRLEGHTKQITSIVFSPDGKSVVSASMDTTIRIWNLNNEGGGECIDTLKGHSKGVRSVAYHPNGKLLASGGYDMELRLWDLNQKKCIDVCDADRNSIRQIVFKPDGKLIIASCCGCLLVWNLETEKGKVTLTRRAQLYIPKGCSFNTVDFSPDGNSFATSGSRGTDLTVWHGLETNIIEEMGYGHEVRYSPDGESLTLINGKDVRIWNLMQKGCAVLEFRADAGLNSVAYSPDGKRLALAGDKAVEIWNIAAALNYKGNNIKG